RRENLLFHSYLLPHASCPRPSPKVVTIPQPTVSCHCQSEEDAWARGDKDRKGKRNMNRLRHNSELAIAGNPSDARREDWPPPPFPLVISHLPSLAIAKTYHHLQAQLVDPRRCGLPH